MYGDWQFGGLNVCAKSGTAEHEGETADAMFAGFCVDENCPLAFVVFVENGGAGSTVAAPMAAKVMKKMLETSKNLTYTDTTVTVKCALNDASRAQIDALADELCK